MNNISIRYSRAENKMPKNTLASVRQGDKIYFGIAKCNSSDLFRKRIGREVATTRALRAINREFNEVVGMNLRLDETGLRGVVDIEYIDELRNYFYDIDSIELIVE
jgi:hypothetical protein